MSTQSKAQQPERAAPDAFHAAVSNDVEELRAALVHGELLNIARGANGFTPLHTAALNGSSAFMIEALTHPSADPWQPDRNGRKAIDIASSAGFPEIVEVLYAAMYPDDGQEIIRQNPDTPRPWWKLKR